VSIENQLTKWLPVITKEMTLGSLGARLLDSNHETDFRQACEFIEANAALLLTSDMKSARSVTERVINYAQKRRL
jgi:hypothetical protein